MSGLAVRHQAGVALLTLDDPRRRNILSAPLCSAIEQAIADAEADETVKAIVVTGRGPSFSAGADLSDLKSAADGDTANVEAVYRSFMAIANCTLPTLAAVNGPAIGAGLNIALACDLRLAAEQAVFDTRFLTLGLHPGGGHGWMLLRAVGWAEAMRMLLLAQPVTAADALRSGLVQQVTPADRLIDTALTLAARTGGLPRSLVMEVKATLRHATQIDHATAFQQETIAQHRSLREQPFRDMVARAEAALQRR